MVGPPSDVKRQVVALFIYGPRHKGGTDMRWLGDLIVYAGIAGMVGFFAYVAIKSRMDENKKKPKP